MADLISRLAARTVRSTGAVVAAAPGTVAARPRPRGVFEPATSPGIGAPPEPADGPLRQPGASVAGSVGHDAGAADRIGHTSEARPGAAPTAGPGSRADRSPGAPRPARATGAGHDPGEPDPVDGPPSPPPERDAGARVPPGRGVRDPRARGPVEAEVHAVGPDRTRGSSGPRPRGPERVVPARVLPAPGARPTPPGRGPGRPDRTRSRPGSGSDADAVSIHIGRLDVRANLEVVGDPATATPGRDRAGPTLEEYLRGGGAGVGR